MSFFWYFINSFLFFYLLYFIKLNFGAVRKGLSMKRRILRVISVVLIITISFCCSSLAGNTNYTLYNLSGKTTNGWHQIEVATSSTNTKAVSYRNWVVKSSSVNYPKNVSSYGIGFVLYQDGYVFDGSEAAETGTETPILWMNSISRVEGSWKSGCGIKGKTYYIGARLDDVLANYGTGSTSGVWNSDSY